LKNKTAFLLDLKVQFAVKKNGWCEFLHQNGSERYWKKKSNNLAYIFILFYIH
jgi:hypothetical protein